MRIITGDECGLLKETIPELSREAPEDDGLSSSTGIVRSGTDEGIHRFDADAPQSRSRGVIGLAFLPIANDDAKNDYEDAIKFAALRADGSFEAWEGRLRRVGEKVQRLRAPRSYRRVGALSDVFATDKISGEAEDAATGKGDPNPSARPIGLCSPLFASRSSYYRENSIIACCDSLGNLSLLDPNALGRGVVARYGAFSQDTNRTITYTKGNFTNNYLATAFSMDADGNRVAVAGRERETVLLDVETGKQLWKAKNLPPDPQTLLQQPVWSTALEFLSQNAQINGSSNILAAGTAYKQLRLYDVRADSTQRRPILYTPDGVLSHRVTSLCQLDAHKIVVGDAAGFIHTIDTRQIGRGGMGRYAGPAGSVRQIVKHETLPVLACVGLDRMLWTFDARKREKLDCVYLKQRLNCMLFCEDETWSSSTFLPESQGENKDERKFTSSQRGLDEADEVEDYVDSDVDGGGEPFQEGDKLVESEGDATSEDTVSSQDEKRAACNSDDDEISEESERSGGDISSEEDDVDVNERTNSKREQGFSVPAKRRRRA